MPNGMAEGLIQGKTAGIIETAKNMLKKGFEPSEIADITNLSIEEINRLK